MLEPVCRRSRISTLPQLDLAPIYRSLQSPAATVYALRSVRRQIPVVLEDPAKTTTIHKYSKYIKGFAQTVSSNLDFCIGMYSKNTVVPLSWVEKRVLSARTELRKKGATTVYAIPWMP